MIRPEIKINSLEIPVSDIVKSIDWYSKALGFTCIWSDNFHALLDKQPSRVDAPEYGIRLLLVKTEDSARLLFRSTNTDIVHSIIDFKTDDLEQFHLYLRYIKANVDSLSPPKNDWAPRGFSFFDLDGNRFGAYTFKR